VLEQCFNVYTVFVVDSSADIADGNDLGPQVGQNVCCSAAHIAKALYSNCSAFDIHIQLLQRFQERHHSASACSFYPAFGTAENNWFACKHGKIGFAVDHRVLIKHPSHDLSVSVYVWGWDVQIRAKNISQCPNIATAEPLKLAPGEFGRVYLNTTLTSTVRKSEYATFKRHPER
jgi:hypothetical protein